MKKAVILGILIIFLFIVPVKADWLSGWGYRKAYIITGSAAGAQTDYQIKLNIFNTMGNDGGDDVYLGDKVRPDFGDVRFTNSAGSLLDYWIEGIEGNSAIVWVKVDNIPASPDNTTIYIYYGNSSATTTSNGTNTFLFYSDRYDYDNWSQSGSVTVTSTSNGLRMLQEPAARGGTVWRTVSVNANKYALEMDRDVAGDSYTNPNFILEVLNNANSWMTGGFIMLPETPFNEYYRINGGAYNYVLYSGYSTDTYYIRREIIDEVNKNVSYYFLGEDYTQLGSVTNIAWVTATPGSMLNITFSTGTRGAADFDVYFKWIRIRKYVSPEPSHEVGGSEGTQGGWGSIENLGLEIPLGLCVGVGIIVIVVIATAVYLKYHSNSVTK